MKKQGRVMDDAALPGQCIAGKVLPHGVAMLALVFTCRVGA
jgi:hypothetical protein